MNLIKEMMESDEDRQCVMSVGTDDMRSSLPFSQAQSNVRTINHCYNVIITEKCFEPILRMNGPYHLAGR